MDFPDKAYTSVTRQSKQTRALEPLEIDEGNQNVVAEPDKDREDTREAFDYLNGGLPHSSLRTPLANGFHVSSSSIPTFKPLATATPPGSSATPDFALSGNAIPTTPSRRRSVQFLRPEATEEPVSPPETDLNADEDGEMSSKDKKSLSLMSKLKLFTSTGGIQPHKRSLSGGTLSGDPGPAAIPNSLSLEGGSRVPRTLEEEGSDVDADAEETADEIRVDDDSKQKRKRRFRRNLEASETQTAPSTPQVRVPPDGSPDALGDSLRPFSIRRRNTMPDAIEEQKLGLSEDEGRDRLGKQSAWRRAVGSSRGLTTITTGPTLENGEITPVKKRPSQFRRAFTGIGGVSDGDGKSPRRPFLGAERATTFTGQKWKNIKHGLKLLGQKKEEQKIDYLKSAELMAELRAGAPAAVILASMIQRDEHGRKRIPVLLEQVKIKVTDSKSMEDGKESERHVVFRIELEYGNGPNRMKWVVERSANDFLTLHARYKLQIQSDKLQLKDNDNRAKQPHFPRSAFRFLGGMWGTEDSSEEEDGQRDDTAPETTFSEAERPARRKKRNPSLGNIRRRSSTTLVDPNLVSPIVATDNALALHRAKVARNVRQREKLEDYLNSMKSWLIFRAESNRLCQFLELSALGVRLAVEGSYHGKEGWMKIAPSSKLNIKQLLIPRSLGTRYRRQWLAVRHSYIVWSDSPEDMTISDVILLDSKFAVRLERPKLKEAGAKEAAKGARTAARHWVSHQLRIKNSERTWQLLAKKESHLRQFEESIAIMFNSSLWSKTHRFGSFAPVRTGVSAQVLVDGRDYMWNVSRAIDRARDVIYIHDWWLSPQLYMRRPPAISQKWRLDRLLKRKASEGIKIYIIIYRNVEAAVPIDSESTKLAMLDLHPNIFVQRSPNQYKMNQYFFAHHEKVCIVDHAIAFVGGIDLCFGRWDTPDHVVSDYKPTGYEPSNDPKDSDHCQRWPGKDYSNPRIQDFHDLGKPYAEMYDRSIVPRMPWHDVSMQVVGQPARDLTRHFVQRWNYVLRGRTVTRPTPFLLPPPDFSDAELERLGLKGTCEVQILRSACAWSLGVDETEHSIMNAYCKMIEESDHFVYIENQFFITSSETMNAKFMNKIGDAIVERAVRAHRDNEAWRCVILIPLLPGFQNTVYDADGTSVRIIMQCQYRSICRGDDSIFGRLRAANIEPEEYVNFYSLRKWGSIGPKDALITEQLYIHAKVIIVDDRIALIGSANINERSMLGDRDSECAAIIRDTDLLPSYMNGEPYLVGRFPHNLRMRLMREHLGVNVDELDEELRAERDDERESFESQSDDLSDVEAEPLAAKVKGDTYASRTAIGDDGPNYLEHEGPATRGEAPIVPSRKLASVVEAMTNHLKKDSKYAGEPGVPAGMGHLDANVTSEIKNNKQHPHRPRSRTLQDGHTSIMDETNANNAELPPLPQFPRRTTDQLGLAQLSQLPALPIGDDTDIGGPSLQMDPDGQIIDPGNPLFADLTNVTVTRDCMKDPLNETFFVATWHAAADNNTKIYRKVFRCNPDNEVKTWAEYKEYEAYGTRFATEQFGFVPTERLRPKVEGKSGPVGASLPHPRLAQGGVGPTHITEKVLHSSHSDRESHPFGQSGNWTVKDQAENEKHANPTEIHPDYLPSEPVDAVRNSDEPVSPILQSGDTAFPSIDAAPTGADPNLENLPSTRTTFSDPSPTNSNLRNASFPVQATPTQHVRRRTRATTTATTRLRKPFHSEDPLLSKDDAEALLHTVRGSLVVFPYDWLESEEKNSKWLYSVDSIAPVQIYD